MSGKSLINIGGRGGVSEMVELLLLPTVRAAAALKIYGDNLADKIISHLAYHRVHGAGAGMTE